MKLNQIDIDRIIEMAWEDRTTFEAIKFQFGLKEQQVIDLMRNQLKPKSFKLWRSRVQGRNTKHEKLRILILGDLSVLVKSQFQIIKFLKDK